MSAFEITMLVCFGSSWPFSIYRLWRTKSATGKSVVFLLLILIGYLAGIAHKIFYAPDPVMGLYAVNALMVGADLALCVRYHRGSLAAGKWSQA